jgi:crotonobetainyl-CoA:carnitine CoA-transferase CaiB-like acyl-CoA transferase
LSGEPNPLARGPFRGEHTDQILRDLCGYTDDHIADLRAAGTFGEAKAQAAADS